MASRIRTVAGSGLPPTNGHYSHAAIYKDTVYISGQLGRGPGMTDQTAGDVEVQTRRSLGSLNTILAASDSDFDHLLKVNIYIADISMWPIVDRVYAELVGAHRPARAIVPVHDLHFGALIEIDATAAIR